MSTKEKIKQNTSDWEHKVVRARLIEKGTFKPRFARSEEVSHADIWGRRFGQRKDQVQRPWGRATLECSEYSKEASVAGEEWAYESVEDEAREVMEDGL